MIFIVNVKPKQITGGAADQKEKKIIASATPIKANETVGVLQRRVFAERGGARLMATSFL